MTDQAAVDELVTSLAATQRMINNWWNGDAPADPLQMPLEDLQALRARLAARLYLAVVAPNLPRPADLERLTERIQSAADLLAVHADDADEWRSTAGLGLVSDAVRMVSELAAYRQSLARTRATETHAIRWCGWPTCFASYTTESSDPAARPDGWIQSVATASLLCPLHSTTPHSTTSSSVSVENWPMQSVTVSCGCSVSGTLFPGTLDQRQQWWRNHVAKVATDQT